MLSKVYIGGFCKYFESALLPQDSELYASLNSADNISLKICPICGNKFISSRRQAYCSSDCGAKGIRLKTRNRLRKFRKKGS
jgi:hypothetical protein